MRKKKFKTLFNDQSSEPYKIKTGPNKFFPIKSSEDSRTKFQKQNESGVIKVFGDTADDIFDPNSGINHKNYYARRTLSDVERDNIHPDLGNGFVVNALDSDKDSLHDFSGFKKFIDLKLTFFSCSANIISGTFINIDNYGAGLAGSSAEDIAVSPIDGAVYVVGQFSGSGASSYSYVRRSITGFSGSFQTVASFYHFATRVAVSPIDGAVYVTGWGLTGPPAGLSIGGFLLRSPSGLSGTFSIVDNDANTATYPNGVAVSPIDGAVYYGTNLAFGGGKYAAIMRRSPSGLSGTFTTVDIFSEATGSFVDIAISPIDGAIYATNLDNGGIRAFLRKSTTRPYRYLCYSR